jgi:hypothetical protein
VTIPILCAAAAAAGGTADRGVAGGASPAGKAPAHAAARGAAAVPAAVDGLVALRAAGFGVPPGGARLAVRAGVAGVATAELNGGVTLPTRRAAAVGIRGASVERGGVGAPLARPTGEAGAGAVGRAAAVAGAVGYGVARCPAVRAELAILAKTCGGRKIAVGAGPPVEAHARPVDSRAPSVAAAIRNLVACGPAMLAKSVLIAEAPKDPDGDITVG